MMPWISFIPRSRCMMKSCRNTFLGHSLHICRYSSDKYLLHYSICIFQKFENWLAQHKTNFLAGDEPTVCDFHFFEMLQQHEVLAASISNVCIIFYSFFFSCPFSIRRRFSVRSTHSFPRISIALRLSLPLRSTMRVRWPNCLLTIRWHHLAQRPKDSVGIFDSRIK